MIKSATSAASPEAQETNFKKSEADLQHHPVHGLHPLMPVHGPVRVMLTCRMLCRVALRSLSMAYNLLLDQGGSLEGSL